MHVMKSGKITALAFGLCLLAVGQNAEPTDTVASAETMRRVIDTISGEWTITWTRFDASRRREVFGTGEEVWKLGPGGTPLIEENRSTVNGHPENDYAAIWWDNKAKKARGIWCHPTINDEGCSCFETTMEGNDVVLTGEWEQKGKRLAWREVYRRVSSAEMTQSLYVGAEGAEMKFANELLAKKK